MTTPISSWSSPPGGPVPWAVDPTSTSSTVPSGSGGSSSTRQVTRLTTDFLCVVARHLVACHGAVDRRVHRALSHDSEPDAGVCGWEADHADRRIIVRRVCRDDEHRRSGWPGMVKRARRRPIGRAAPAPIAVAHRHERHSGRRLAACPPRRLPDRGSPVPPQLRARGPS